MRRRGAQYKHYHDKKGRFQLNCVSIRKLFVKKPPLSSDRDTVDWTATASYNELPQPKTGRFCTTKVQSHTVVIDEDGVPSIVSIHRVTAAPAPK